MLSLLLALAAAGPVSPAPAPLEVVAAAPASDWVKIAPADLLVMELATDVEGRPRRVVIQLIPPPFSQGWVSNIRKLAAAHWWDGTSINRVQDNYVTQWGDHTEKKLLPVGLAAVATREYEARLTDAQVKSWSDWTANTISLRLRHMPTDRRDDAPPADSYAPFTGFVSGFPAALEPYAAPSGAFIAWPVHCYGMVGVGRGMPPDSGSGAELYTVIGHAPRHLDRNIALVGRVIEGIEHLSSLPRGTGALGFYEAAAERVPIRSVRLASDLPAAADLDFEYLSTETASFARYSDARANRRDAFFIKPAGGADICNIPVPVRRAPPSSR